MEDYLGLVRPWKIGPARELAKTRVFTLKERRAESVADPSKAADFVFLDCAEWANVVAVTPDRKIVMVEQYRHGIGMVTLEIPGGIVDEGGRRRRRACASCWRRRGTRGGGAGRSR